METKTFDARGMACPLPVVNAKKESEEMTNGGTLIILVDNEIAVQNLTKFGNSKGFTVSSEKKTEKEKEYSILLADTTMSILKKLYPECEIAQLKDITLSSAWTTFMSKGKQPSAPEDYIEVEK